jgi:hypothetical protein
MKKIPASFHRYVVSGPKPTIDAILALLRDHAFKTGDFGKPDEVEYGWSGGDHVLDAEFSFDHNVFGDVLVFGLRIDTNKPPGSLKTAYLAQECQALAAGNPSGFISKAQKRNAKETVARKLEDEIRSGQHRRSKVVPVLWDLAAGASDRGVLRVPAAGHRGPAPGLRGHAAHALRARPGRRGPAA